MKHPPPSHFRYFIKECACILLEGEPRHAVLFKQVNDAGGIMFSYRCAACAHMLTQYIPHRLVGDSPSVDLDAWFKDRSLSSMAREFERLPGVLSAAMVIAPAPGELPEESLVRARLEHQTYFVDEAGDLTLFGKRRVPRLGTPGCSRSFILGAVSFDDYETLASDLKTLHASLLKNPAFQSIESLKPERGLTFKKFHACKDHPRVRERVFETLQRHPARVFLVVRRKDALLKDEQLREQAGRPLSPWQREYDSMVSRLFTNRMHLARHTNIVIARRGTSNRDIDLRKAVSKAKIKFEKRWEVTNPHTFEVSSAEPENHPGLQAVDYYLWAAQRIFERGDFARFDQHRDAYRLIVDVDDRRRSYAGAWYSSERPITPEKIKPFEG
jgi:hypothetical protein